MAHRILAFADLEAFAENHPRPGRPSVVLHFRSGPALSFMEGDGAFIPDIGDRLEAATAGGTRLLFEGLIEHLADPSSSVIWMNPHEMNVPCFGWPRSDKAKEKSDHDPVVLNDAR